MDALRQYLTEMPKLPRVLNEFLGEIIEAEKIDYNRLDDMREAVGRAQAQAMAALKERQIPYFVVTYPQAVHKCPECANEEIKGAFYEISNPVTNARGQFRVRIMHDFLVHGRPVYNEPIVNMSETKVGDDEHHLDVKKLAKILQGLPLPQPVQAELQAALAPR